MSRENVDIVRRDITARNERDWTDLGEVWHPEIEWDVVRGGTFRGIDEITGFFDSLSELHADYRVEERELIDAGEQVVTVERILGRGLKGSEAGGWIGETLFRVIEFKDDRVWRVTEYPTRDAALAAAGVTNQA